VSPPATMWNAAGRECIVPSVDIGHACAGG
jgi:hypothetical protein